MDNNTFFKVGGISVLAFILLNAALYIANAVHFIRCDFEAPYKGEVLHGLGLCTPVFWITGWASFDK